MIGNSGSVITCRISAAERGTHSHFSVIVQKRYDNKMAVSKAKYALPVGSKHRYLKDGQKGRTTIKPSHVLKKLTHRTNLY